MAEKNNQTKKIYTEAEVVAILRHIEGMLAPIVKEIVDKHEERIVNLEKAAAIA